MAIRTNRDLTWTIVVALAALLVLIVVSVSLSLPKFRILQKLMDRLNLIVNERLSGLLVIRAFHRETSEEQRFDKANMDLMKTNLFVSRLMSFMMPGMTLIMSYGSLLVVWAGAGLIQQDRLAVGDMMAFIQYAMHVVMSFLFLTMFFIMLPRAMVSAQRVQEVLSMEPSISEVCLENQESLPLDTPGEVVFDKVCFRYPDAEEDVLHDISFRAKPGTWTAIVGGTGSGKSTLINLLPRFYDVTQGSITVDGVDIRHLCHENLRQLIGYVPQKGILFSGSIRSNVTYANPEMDETTLTQAMKISQSYDFVEEKPEGLETSIAQGGTNVSGGQRQRLSIARAIAKNSPIYIFDDSFSALDFATEVSLRKAMLNSLGNRTVFVVAQRISTVKDAHQIIVLEEGKVAGMGTHSQLLGTCPVYRELAASQLQITSEGGDSHGRS
jgi:ATP-binding cassette subfamily B protein